MNFKQNKTNFEKELGVFADRLNQNRTECEKFEKLTGVVFTITNARNCLLDAATEAMIYFHNDPKNFRLNKAKKYFKKLLASLPYKSLPDIAKLIKFEVLAHLQLDYGDVPIFWLNDKEIINTNI